MATSSEHWVTEPTGYLEPKMGYGIPGGYGSIPAITVVKRFAATAAKHPTANAMALKRPVVSSIFYIIVLIIIFLIFLIIYFI